MIKELIHTIEGDGVTEEFLIEHGFDTLNIMHEIYDATTLEMIIADVSRIDSNTVKVSFGQPLETDDIFKVILRAKGIKSPCNCDDDSGEGTLPTVRLFPVNNQWRSVCYAENKDLFVAIPIISGTNNQVMTSPDGINWTPRQIPVNDWRSVCYAENKGLFVAVGMSGMSNRVMTSLNGINWTLRQTPANNPLWNACNVENKDLLFAGWSSVCYAENKGLFVAVAASGASKRVMTSPDGINWTLRQSGANIRWNSVCYAEDKGLFVAVTSTGVMTSPDGINWTLRQTPVDNDWRSVYYAENIGLFVAVADTGEGNRIMTSPDGITWTSR